MAREFYPMGQLTLGDSVVLDVDGLGVDVTNAAALHACLADPNGIPVSGMISCTFTFDLKITNDQADAGKARVALIDAVLAGASGGTLPLGYVNGSLALKGSITASQAKLAAKLGDPNAVSFTGLGKVTNLQGL